MADAVGLKTLKLLLTLGVLAGCSAQGGAVDERAGSFLVSPGKYDFYNCDQMVHTSWGLSQREIELRNLMTRAEGGAGGGLVSAIAYRPEYAQVRGEIAELRKSAAQKNCALTPPPSPAASTAATPARTRSKPIR